MRKLKNYSMIDESVLFTYTMPRYGYPLRPAQLEMSKKVDEAFQGNKVFIAEAEVGTGKTFAYLIPAINQIKRTRLPVLVSTGTISLQEQLCMRDIPQLSRYLKKEDLIDRDLTVSLEKGKENYLCEKKLSAIRNPDEVTAAIKDGYQNHHKFDRTDFDFPISNEIWDRVSVHNCNLGKCPIKDCQYRNKRLKGTESDIMVCNHYYLLSCLKDERRNFLEQFSGIVIDEAHNLENAAFAIFGENKGYDNYESCIRAALSYSNKPDYIDMVKRYAENAARIAGELFEAVGRESVPPEYAPEYATEFKVNITLEIEDIAHRLSDSLHSLSDQISIYQTYHDSSKDSDDNIQKQIGRLIYFLRSIYNREDYVWWSQKERGLFRLYNIPKTIASDLYDALFSQSKPVILTSATLSANPHAHDKECNFDYFAFKTGIDRLRTSQYLPPISKKSGFDYAAHGLIYIEKDIPYVDRSRGAEYIEYLRKLAERIRQAILYSEGRTMVLFTSKDAMEFSYSLVAKAIRNELGVKCYMQGQSPYVKTQFEKEVGSCLFATGSFWEGIDIKGPSLSTLVIHKLPFPVPTSINEYKEVQMRAEGLGSILLPEMLTKLKQGAGRLIRDVTDRGALVILDSRAATKRYAGIICKNLPPFRPIGDLKTIKEFLQEPRKCEDIADSQALQSG